jgi:hypothetical protein
MSQYICERKGVIAFLLLVTLGMTGQAEEQANVKPYRPSVSNPAQLPAPGQLELELGGLTADTGRLRRDSLPYLFKYAFSSEWGLLVGGDAWVHDRQAGGSGFGDTDVILKRAFLVDDATAFGLEFGPTLPTAPTPVGSGKADWRLNTIYSKDLGPLHVDMNLNVTRLGMPDPGASRILSGASASFSVELDRHWSATWELSGTRNSGAASTAQFLAALSYAPTKRIAIDAGFAKGLNPASPDWSLFGGLVVPLAKLR